MTALLITYLNHPLTAVLVRPFYTNQAVFTPPREEKVRPTLAFLNPSWHLSRKVLEAEILVHNNLMANSFIVSSSQNSVGLRARCHVPETRLLVL